VEALHLALEARAGVAIEAVGDQGTIAPWASTRRDQTRLNACSQWRIMQGGLAHHCVASVAAAPPGMVARPPETGAAGGSAALPPVSKHTRSGGPRPGSG
jgi:hypothetical protein